MLRRSSAVATGVAAIGIVLASGAPAHATISHWVTWDVSLTATETRTWSFSGRRPDTCAQYLGVPAQEADGSGAETVSVATTKRRHLLAQTYRMGRKLRFSSVATSAKVIPTTASRRGTASSRPGPECNASVTDPEPLPAFADSSGCKTKKGTAEPDLSWTPGELVVRLGVAPTLTAWTRCPDVDEPQLHVLEDTSCGPKTPGTIYLSALKFMLRKPKTFTVAAKHRYVCPIPVSSTSWWSTGTGSLTTELSTSYEVTFTPWKR